MRKHLGTHYAFFQGGDCKLHWYPKFYLHIVLFVGWKSKGNFIEFWLVGSELVKFSANNFYLEIRGSFIPIKGSHINKSSIVLSLKIPETMSILLVNNKYDAENNWGNNLCGDIQG